MKRQNKDDAVSPVVGVMIMLTITVLLAAVFAATATGLFSGGVDKPANAEINYLSSTDDMYTFEMTAGDSVSLSQLKVVFTLRDDKTKQQTVYGSDMETRSSDYLKLGDLLQADKPDFAADGKYVVWMFYDTNSGKLLSSGEIYQ
ncbi:MAG TPA: type IV pilin N-terminal domain-containing protein [Methanocorpusculum sp.]|nr:type IV pilin N-terminal domain-containing protein [Methanocorpusculum sp.]